MKSDKGKLILFTGVYQTLDLFTRELYKAFAKIGYEILIVDSNHMKEEIFRIASYVQTPVKAVITFNHLGMQLELVKGQNLWEQLGIPCIDILVDHPCWYLDILEHAPSNAVILCIDRNHMNYVRRFYPWIKMTGFLPHGGTDLLAQMQQEPLPIRSRSIEILYAGGLSRDKALQNQPDFDQMNQTYEIGSRLSWKQIADQIYQRLLDHYELPYEVAVEQVICEYVPEYKSRYSEAILSEIMTRLNYIEMLATSYYREKVVRTLVQAGCTIDLYGEGWEHCSWIESNRVRYHGKIEPEGILLQMQNAKIVLNTMTWFKDGIHERIVNGMLAGAVVVSDESGYLMEEFKDQILTFSLAEINQLPSRIQKLCEDMTKMQRIADQARSKAKHHTWQQRAMEMDQDLLQML